MPSGRSPLRKSERWPDGFSRPVGSGIFALLRSVSRMYCLIGATPNGTTTVGSGLPFARPILPTDCRRLSRITARHTGSPPQARQPRSPGREGFRAGSTLKSVHWTDLTPPGRGRGLPRQAPPIYLQLECDTSVACRLAASSNRVGCSPTGGPPIRPSDPGKVTGVLGSKSENRFHQTRNHSGRKTY